MKYIVDVFPELAKKVDALVIQGKYESISQFANVAFQNQLLLEDSPRETLENLMKPSVSTLKSTEIAPSASSLSIDFRPENIRVLSPPDESKIPNDCLWGQYNRIFPVKITLRILANNLKDNESIALDLLQTQAVEAAREVGLSLKKEDRRSRRKYGDMLSSALPTARNVAKTEKRFISHFVGYYTRAGRIEGAPGALKFLNIIEDEEGVRRVGITEDGLKFAALSNPVLDESTLNKTLNRAESLFYVEHTYKSLEREKELNILILKAISENKSSPSELNNEISPLSRGWSESMLSTIRAGAISRLNELGLITRMRSGVGVSYSLTQDGREVLNVYQRQEK